MMMTTTTKMMMTTKMSMHVEVAEVAVIDAHRGNEPASRIVADVVVVVVVVVVVCRILVCSG